MLFGKPKTIIKGELRDVDVRLVSLLFDGMTPANQKGFVVKSADGKFSYNMQGGSDKFFIEKAADQGRLFVTLMEPGVKDSQGDSYSEAEVRKAAYLFSKENSMVGRLDVNHNMHPIPDFYVAESYLLKTADKEHFPTTALGSWVQVLQCNDLNSELWQKVVKGGFNGVSIFGKAVEIDDARLAEMQQEIIALKAQVASMTDGPDKQKLADQIAKLETLFAQKPPDDTGEVVKSVQELTRVLTKGISRSIKDEPAPAPDETIFVGGQKVLYKAANLDLYKGIANLRGERGQDLGYLAPNLAEKFIDAVVEPADDGFFNDITVVHLDQDNSIDRGLIDKIIMKNTADGDPAGQEVAASRLVFAPQEVRGFMKLKDTTAEEYEQKYGIDKFGAWVENKIRADVRENLQMFALEGDRASSDLEIKGMDGIIKLATAASDVTTISKTTYATWQARLSQALRGFSNRMLAKRDQFVIYLNAHDLIDLEDQLSARQTAEGDRIIRQGGNLFFRGIPLKAQLIPADYIIAGLSKYLLVGARSDAKLNCEYRKSEWAYYWHVRCNAGVSYIPNFIKVFELTTTSGS